jgi:hypothetical protein
VALEDMEATKTPVQQEQPIQAMVDLG